MKSGHSSLLLRYSLRVEARASNTRRLPAPAAVDPHGGQRQNPAAGRRMKLNRNQSGTPCWPEGLCACASKETECCQEY